MLTKSLASAADSLILDLEDAVVPDQKLKARATVADWLAQVPFGEKEKCVRINALDTPWCLDDINATMAHPPDTYVVPKISTVEQLQDLSAHIAKLEAQYQHPAGGVGLIVIATETPRSALNVSSFPECDRVHALTWGAEDLAAELGAVVNRDSFGRYLPPFEHCRSMTLLSAIAGRVAAIDTVYVDFRDATGLAADCQLAANIGFTGKLTIHPDQIDIVNQAFSPDPEAVQRATRLIAAFEESQQQGLMAISFEGSMVDVPHLHNAHKLIARDAQIKAKLTD